jgi:hypothetical protein
MCTAFDPQPDPDPTGNCWAGAISWNPVDWVQIPVQCAWQWAMIPPGGFNGQIGRFGAAWDGSVPGQWRAWAGGLSFPAGGGNSSCQGPAVPTGVLGTGAGAIGPILPGTIYPFSACSGVMQKAAQTSNAICAAIIIFFGGMKVLRVVLRAFGMYVPEARDPWRPVTEPDGPTGYQWPMEGGPVRGRL